MKSEDIPYFIKIRGCINCDASKTHKKRHGTNYGVDHELMVRCIVGGCVNYGVTLVTPFIDPEEVVRIAKEEKLTKENVKKYCLDVKDKFGKYYKKLGISLENII